MAGSTRPLRCCQKKSPQACCPAASSGPFTTLSAWLRCSRVNHCCATRGSGCLPGLTSQMSWRSRRCINPSLRAGGIAPSVCFGSMASTLLFSRAPGSSDSSTPSRIRHTAAHSSAGRRALRCGKALAFCIGQAGGRQLVAGEGDIRRVALLIVQANGFQIDRALQIKGGENLVQRRGDGRQHQ